MSQRCTPVPIVACALIEKTYSSEYVVPSEPTTNVGLDHWDRKCPGAMLLPATSCVPVSTELARNCVPLGPPRPSCCHGFVPRVLKNPPLGGVAKIPRRVVVVPSVGVHVTANV